MPQCRRELSDPVQRIADPELIAEFTPDAKRLAVELACAISIPLFKGKRGQLAQGLSDAEAILDNVTSVPGVRRAWRMLMGGASDRSPCAKLAEGSP